jgi:hypothetical protein
MKQFKSLQSLFRENDHFTKGEYAQMKNGEVCSPRDKEAVKFCLYGAIDRVYGNSHEGAEAVDRLIIAVNKLFPCFTNSITSFNDAEATTIRDIRKVVKEAKV